MSRRAPRPAGSKAVAASSNAPERLIIVLVGAGLSDFPLFPHADPAAHRDVAAGGHQPGDGRPARALGAIQPPGAMDKIPPAAAQPVGDEPESGES